MQYTLSRGVKDILPDEMRYWHTIESVSRNLFALYNYHEIRTPIFEVTELFQRSIGDETDIVSKEMYTFMDKGNRQITLRPEGTAPIVRAYIQHNMHKTVKTAKLYYCGPMFRYERPQAGRFRQFHQIGIEQLGTAHPYSDAEVISLGIHLFDEVGLSDLTVSINSVGCSVCRPVIEERLKQFIANNLSKLCGDCQHRYKNKPLRILDCKNPSCQTYTSGMPDIQKSLCQECKDHFSSVLEYIDTLGIPFQINPKLVRGLDYYTRTTFEIISDSLGAQNAICGGGRYDKLVKHLGGPDMPAVGFAFGIERAVMILKQIEDQNPMVEQTISVYVAPLGDLQRTKAFYILDELRREGIKCDMDFTKNDIKGHLKQANRLKAKYALIYGDEEAEKKTILVKNLETRQQQEVGLDAMINCLKDDEQI